MTQRSEIQTVLTADTSNLVKGLNRAKSEGERFKGVMDRVTGSFKSALGGLGVGLGAGALTAGLVSAVKRTLDFAEQIENMSASTGLGGEAIQALSIAAKDSGVSVTLLESQLIKLNEMVNTDKGKEELAKLGITATNSADAIDQLAKAFGNADGSKLAQLTDVLGDKFAKLMPLISQINDNGGLGGLSSGMKNDGLIISDENLKQLQEADKIVDGIKNKLTVQIAEGISYWMKLLDGDSVSPKVISSRRNLMDMARTPALKVGIEDIYKNSAPDISKSKSDYIHQETDKFIEAYKERYEFLESLEKEFQLESKKSRYGITDDARFWGEAKGMTNVPDIIQSYAVELKKNMDVVAKLKSEMQGQDFTRIGEQLMPKLASAYDNAKNEADAAYQKKLDAAHAILAKGEAERDISDAILSINEQIAKKKEEIAKLSDPEANAKAQVQLERLRMNLEKQLAAEQKKKDDEALKSAQDLNDIVDKNLEIEGKRSELRYKEANIPGFYEGMTVDEYAKVGKFIGPQSNEKIVELDLQKKQTEYLKDIRDDIQKLDTTYK